MVKALQSVLNYSNLSASAVMRKEYKHDQTVRVPCKITAVFFYLRVDYVKQKLGGDFI